MICKACKKRIEDDSVYCRFCGCKLEQKTEGIKTDEVDKRRTSLDTVVEVLYDGSEEVKGVIDFLSYRIQKGYYYCAKNDSYYVPIAVRSVDWQGEVSVSFEPQNEENRGMILFAYPHQGYQFGLYQISGEKFRGKKRSKETISAKSFIMGCGDSELVINFVFEASNTKCIQELEDLEKKIIDDWRNVDDNDDDLDWDTEWILDADNKYYLNRWDEILIKWYLPDQKLKSLKELLTT